jgi:hypothetical protein
MSFPTSRQTNLSPLSAGQTNLRPAISSQSSACSTTAPSPFFSKTTAAAHSPLYLPDCNSPSLPPHPHQHPSATPFFPSSRTSQKRPAPQPADLSPFLRQNSLPDPQNWRINCPSLPFQHLTTDGPKPERNPLIFLLLCCSFPSSSHRRRPSPLPADPNRPPAAAQPSTETHSPVSRLKQRRRRNQEKSRSKRK